MVNVNSLLIFVPTETNKVKDMTTLEKLTAELETAKMNIKFAKAAQLIIDTFNKRDEIRFETMSGRFVELFERGNFISCGRLDLTDNQIKHFEEMHLLCFDKKADYCCIKGLRSALKLFTKQGEENNHKGWNILFDMAEEQIK